MRDHRVGKYLPNVWIFVGNQEKFWGQTVQPSVVGLPDISGEASDEDRSCLFSPLPLDRVTLFQKSSIVGREKESRAGNSSEFETNRKYRAFRSLSGIDGRVLRIKNAVWKTYRRKLGGWFFFSQHGSFHILSSGLVKKVARSPNFQWEDRFSFCVGGGFHRSAPWSIQEKSENGLRWSFQRFFSLHSFFNPFKDGFQPLAEEKSFYFSISYGAITLASTIHSELNGSFQKGIYAFSLAPHLFCERPKSHVNEMRSSPLSRSFFVVYSKWKLSLYPW